VSEAQECQDMMWWSAGVDEQHF